MRASRHFSHLSLSRRVAIRTLIAFLITVAVLRVITAIIHYDIFPNGPFRFVGADRRARVGSVFRCDLCLYDCS